jgi:O-antigen/teichoic acid export membrane protein
LRWWPSGRITDFDMAMTSHFGESFQRFLRNFIAHSFGQAVNITTQIFSVPLFLHYWSTTEYGEWLILTSVPMLLWTLDNGLAGLAGNRMTMVTGKGDWAEANLIFRNILLVQGLLCVFLFGITVAIVDRFNISSIFGFRQMPRAEAGTVLLLMIGYLLLGFCFGLMRAVYRACKLEDRAVTLVNFWKLTDFLMIVFILPFGGHPVQLAAGLVGSISFWIISSFIDVRRRCPQIKFVLGPLHARELRKIVVDGLPVLSGEAAGAFFIQGYPLVVNRVLGPTAVVILTTIRTASRTVLQVGQMVSFSSGSELARTYGARDWEGYLRLLKVMLAVTFWTAMIAGIGLTVAGPWVLAKWTGGKVLVSHQILFLFALSVICQSGWGACGSILVSTNMHHSFNYLYLFLTMTGLALVTFSMHVFGFIGVPLVMLMVDCALLAFALYVCARKLSFVPLASLACVFQPGFYLRQAEALLNRIR